jgi:hypothetical protein
MGACENLNLPVEMVEGRVKYRANEPAAPDTAKLPEPYPRIRSIRSSSTPSNGERHLNAKYPSGFRDLERSLQVGNLSGSIAGWGSRQ